MTKLQWLQKYNLLAFDDIDSTNNEAKRLVQTGVSDSLIIWAKEQTAGRGRYGREWASIDGNLYMSIMIPISCSLANAAQLSFVTGLAVHEVITSLAKKHNVKIPIHLKWPNDIFIDDNKIGGILLESITHVSQPWIIIGVGLNIDWAPSDIDNTSSLKKYGINISAGHALDMIVNAFEYYNNLWQLYGFDNIRESWIKHAYRLGQVVTVSDTNKRISGVFESIDKTGAMRIKLASGEICVMSHGEMFFHHHP